MYGVGHALLTRPGRWMAAVLACGDGAVLSHRAAAAHWGILPFTSSRIDVTVPRRGGRATRERITEHRVRCLAPDEHSIHDRIAVTTVARTLFDLAGEVSTPDGRACRRAVGAPPALRPRGGDAVLERHPRKPGAPLLRAILVGYRDGHVRTRQELERLFFGLCECHAIPLPEVNSFVGPYEVDFHWADRRLVAECDGWSTHASRAAFERDRARDAWLTAHGHRVVRFTWRRVLSEPGEVAGLLRGLLAQAS